SANGVEGLPAESFLVELAAGPARISITALREPGPQADRNLDFLFLTDDLEDSFRARGVRAYPLLDEIGWAASGRTFIRLTNPPDARSDVSYEAQYAVNRQPWTLPMIQIGRDGLQPKTSQAQRLATGERTPWVDLSCRDTTHDC